MLPLTQFEFWIFDLDGTITHPVHDFAEIRRVLGVPAEADILEFIDSQPEPEQQRLNQQLIRIEESLAAQAKANPQAVETLRCIADQGCQLGILTRNKRHCVDLVLETLGCLELFEPQAIIASENAPPKPQPDGILQLLDFWQAMPEQSLIMGDFLFDLQAGRAAGIHTLHFAPPGEKLWPEYTDRRVECFSTILAELRAAV